MIEVSQELLAFLRTEYDRCRDDDLTDERAAAIDFYNGEPFGDEEEGRSQLVTRDVAEVIDYMVISILRTLVSGDRVVEFVHRNSELARQATETIMHLFMDEQDGYEILHDWLKAGLLEKTAVIMTYPQPQPAKRVTKEIPVELLGEVDAIEAEPLDEEETMWRVVVLEEQPPRFCDHAVPNEEFYCSPDARTLEEAALKGRETPKPVSDLVEMGFTTEDLDSVGHEHDWTGILSGSRDENRNVAAEDRKGPNRVVKWQESFVRFDENGDGIAELLFVQHIGDHIFSIDEMEEVGDQPFEDWCPFPMPHRRVGQSLADKVMDIQRTRSVLMRQAMDNLYQSNSPRVLVHDTAIGENTVDDLLTVRPGALVRWGGAIKPEPFAVPFVAGNAFEAMEIMAGERESRTGITRLNQGLDADALNKTATGTALMQAQGQQVEEYLARNFVNSLARLFTKKAKLLKRYGQPLMIPIDGEFVEVDPRQWPEDMLARPRVGLGSGRKEQRLIYRQQIAEMQAVAMQNGLSIVNEEKLFNSARGLVADMGLGHVGEYFVDPADLQQIDPETGQPVPPPEKPDPEMVKVQGEQQLKAAELEGKQQEKAAELEMQRSEGELKLEFERARAGVEAELARDKAQAEIDLARARAEAEASLAQQRFASELEMNERRLQMEERIAERNAARADSESETKLKKLRPGGDLAK